MTELTIDQALKQAIEAHKAGQVQEADRLYTVILKAQPKHPDANHNMGVLAVGVGKVQEALPLFKTALEANPATAQFWLSYIGTLIKLDKLNDAKAVLDQAKSKGAKGDSFNKLEQRLKEIGQEPLAASKTATEVQPPQPNILDSLKLDQAINLAKKKSKAGTPEEAKRIYQDILMKFPKNKQASDGLKALEGGPVGDVSKVQDPPQDQLQHLIDLNSQGQLQQAIEQANILLMKFPNSSVLYNICGAVYQGLGQLDASVEAYKKVLAIKPNYAEAYYNIGNTLREQGKLEEAIKAYKNAIAIKPDYAEALINRGLIRLGQENKPEALSDLELAHRLKPHIKQIWDLVIGLKTEAKHYSDAILLLINMNEIDPEDEKRLAMLALCYQHLKDFVSSEEAYKKALAIKPDNLAAQTNLGSALKEQGKLEEAIEAYNKAIAIKPDHADAHYNMGNALKEQGKLEEAIEAYTKALAIKPDYAEAHNNMGVTLQEQGKLEEAIEANNKALAIKPDDAEAYYNMGVTLKEQGKLEEAIEAYNKALAIKPDYADAYYNMGNDLKEQGKLGEAIEAYTKALAIKPDYAEAYNNMGIALRGIAFKKPNSGLQSAITSLLDQKSFVRPIDIASAAISLLKFEPKLNQHLQTSSVAEVMPKVMAIITDLSELPLLLKLMSVCPLPDLDLENLFRELRASLLLSISDLTGSAQELEFQSALALQCFTNEYIYNQSEHEDQAIAALEMAIKKVLSIGEQPSPQSILCLASYRPLNQYDWSSSLLITDEIEDVFTRQVLEPNQEANLKSELPVLEEITDEVSSKVRDQYEVSPYPRWINLGFPLKPAPISKVVEENKLKLFDDRIKEVEAPNILIAGCGTGQHSIGTAATFKGSKVLAIDLSLSSLSYARRKTEELGIQNIDYLQTDILDLGKLGRQFDIVESAGVLHHMDDPLAGWRVLTDCLKPGGLMNIGLYSEMARQHIVEMRQEISKAGIGSSDAAMKSFRTTVMTSDQKHHKKILNSSDFYSLSALKDLLFHVQEHRFTIPQIQNCLSELGLKFCGFEADKIVSHFKLTNTNTDDPYNLDKWHAYEEGNPRAFAGMYQFWFQKTA